MTQYTCMACGQAWPENYCPTCHATIDRGALATAVAAPLGRVPPAAFAWTPVVPPRTAADAGSSGNTVRFGFTGTAGEYFRIWIVNVALTVLTLGIYAAWGKVRKRRWFWSNTQLGERSFEYTGNPVAILKGNLILGACAIAYYLAARVQPLLGLASAAAIWLVYPWLFQRAMCFNAWNTRHRNIRFGFRGTVGESYAINFGLLLLMPFTLGFIWPYAQYRRKRYQLGNLSFGSATFRFDGEADAFYTIFFKSLGLCLVGLVLAFGVAVAIVAVLRVAAPGAGASKTLIGGVTLVAVYVAAMVVMGVYYPTRVTNYALGRTSIDGVASLRATLRAREVLGLELVNLLAIVGTLGLATPWAAVRRAQYRWSHVEAEFVGPVERVTAIATPAPGALGDVAADQFDIDISL